jgi:hypothetical protein
MAASSSNEGAFLLYLTVFRARLGVANIVLPMTGFAYEPTASLLRRIKLRLSETVDVQVADPQNEHVFEYLMVKKLIRAPGKEASRAGRYGDFFLRRDGGVRVEHRTKGPIDTLPVFRVDLWMADPALPSTVGVPTPDNCAEVLDLCHQFGLLSKRQNVWTGAGRLARELRRLTEDGGSNPFVLGPEAIVYLRQVLDLDGIFLCELLRFVQHLADPFVRDDVARKLPEITESAYLRAQGLQVPSKVLSETRKYVLSLRRRTRTGAVRGGSAARGVPTNVQKSASGGPGVLEHRTSARLEWLVDFGVLSKEGGAKNAFTYRKTPALARLLLLLDEALRARDSAGETAIRVLRAEERWQKFRSALPLLSVEQALLQGYRMMHRPVGPASIQEVSFLAGLFEQTQTLSPKDLVAKLIEWSSRERRITLSGGRYTRRPEFVHITPDMLL